jgi:uncharacterized membrane protein YuzA (DUF378 family)
MKTVNIVTLGIVIAAGLNWGSVAWFEKDGVSALLGASTIATQLVYLVFALAALYQLLPLWLSLRLEEPDVQANRVS